MAGNLGIIQIGVQKGDEEREAVEEKQKGETEVGKQRGMAGNWEIPQGYKGRRGDGSRRELTKRSTEIGVAKGTKRNSGTVQIGVQKKGLRGRNRHKEEHLGKQANRTWKQ